MDMQSQPPIIEKEIPPVSTSLHKRVEQFLIRQVVFATAGTAQHMSLEKSYRMADRLACLLYHTYPRLRRTALANLKIAFGDTHSYEELVQIARKSFRNHCRTVIEILRMPDLSVEELCRSVRIDGNEHFDEALKADRGAILLSAHYGNWEMMGARLATAGYPMWVLTRDQRDAALTKLINDCRARFGMRVICRGETRRTLTCLRKNGVLGILSDQHESGGVLVDFFGRPAKTAIGAAVLAMRTGAAIVPAFIARDEQNRHHIRVQPPLELVHTDNHKEDILANTALITQVIEREVAQRPEEWLWVHRRWK